MKLHFRPVQTQPGSGSWKPAIKWWFLGPGLSWDDKWMNRREWFSHLQTSYFKHPLGFHRIILLFLWPCAYSQPWPAMETSLQPYAHTPPGSIGTCCNMLQLGPMESNGTGSRSETWWTSCGTPCNSYRSCLIDVEVLAQSVQQGLGVLFVPHQVWDGGRCCPKRLNRYHPWSATWPCKETPQILGFNMFQPIPPQKKSAKKPCELLAVTCDSHLVMEHWLVTDFSTCPKSEAPGDPDPCLFAHFPDHLLQQVSLRACITENLVISWSLKCQNEQIQTANHIQPWLLGCCRT